MSAVCYVRRRLAVALRKESVDRNVNTDDALGGIVESLSARRAWIEMTKGSYRNGKKSVALRKESVDRNLALNVVDWLTGCRSPQGERG